MNPYAAPGTRPHDAEADIAAATPPPLAKVAGGLVVLGGVVVALAGLQTLAVVTIRGPLQVAPYALALLGAAAIGSGIGIFRARGWAALAGTIGSFLNVLASGAWLLATLASGVFQMYALAAPFVSLVGGIMAIVAMGPCERASAARRRLREQGMDLGI